ncbi:HD domain-containing protein [Bacillus testis]|uniref:HD domain-containing protein n=1 Tax=Bacillus testis TaxID=1622072 RepID=UPI00067F0530|nr:HD domain-containing protein [Bacillus testis]
MNIYDELYGEYTIEPVLQRLIESKAVQRLKGIHQGGASYLVNPEWNVTRYEHSIGVMLLIRKLGGSLEEQIAGLLHDVSHTAFSHVVDLALDHPLEDYHERIFSSFINQWGIVDLLKDFGYDAEAILLDDSQWPLLEQPLPLLCADRIDYTLRDMYRYGVITREEAIAFLENVMVNDGQICLKSIAAAEWFVETYYKEVIDFFMAPLNVYGYEILAGTLRAALRKGILAITDFEKEDEDILAILKESRDLDIQNKLQLLERTDIIEDDQDYQFHQKKKIRLIDPPVRCGQHLYPASRLSAKVAQMNKEAYEKSQKGVYIRTGPAN